MNQAELIVWMDGALCGRLAQGEGGALTFTYEPAYVEGADATPLSLSMPLSRVLHPHRVTQPFFANLLPDNAAALSATAERYGVSPRNPFAILQHTGADVAGALQVLPPGVQPTDGDAGSALHQVPEDELEQQLVGVLEEYRTGRGVPELVQRISLAGAQPKLALHRGADDKWYRSTGAAPTTHILKPLAQYGYDQLDLVEHLTMRAARHLGISTASSDLLVVGATRVFVAERYDRRYENGRWSRLHQEDLCQALGVPPEKKYQRLDGGPGVGRIAQIFRGLPVAADRRSNASAFFRALMFNCFVQATDAHAKNYSVLLVGDRVVLAPLYDLVTFAPYAKDQPIHSAMQIGGEYVYTRIGREQCLSAARTLGVAEDEAVDVIEGLSADLVDAFERARAELDDSELQQRAASVVDAVARLRSPLRPSLPAAGDGSDGEPAAT